MISDTDLPLSPSLRQKNAATKVGAHKVWSRNIFFMAIVFTDPVTYFSNIAYQARKPGPIKQAPIKKNFPVLLKSCFGFFSTNACAKASPEAHKIPEKITNKKIYFSWRMVQKVLISYSNYSNLCAIDASLNFTIFGKGAQ